MSAYGLLPDAAGFRNRPGSSSSSRTTMIPELTLLLSVVGTAASLDACRSAIVDENVLGKPSLSARQSSFGHLRDRYTLDHSVPLFRGMTRLWEQDPAAQPLLAVLLAAARDPVLRVGAGVIQATPFGTAMTWPSFQSAIRDAFQDGHSEKSVRIMAERQPACWDQSGHLQRETPSRRVRGRATSRPTAVAYALWLGFLTGLGGDDLFTSPWARILDAPPELLDQQAREAGAQGLIDLRRGGGVTSVGFRYLSRNDTVVGGGQ